MKPNRKFLMAAMTAACLTTVMLRAQTPAAPQAPAPTLEGYPAIGSPSVIKMIDAGAQPRKALRYTVPADFKGRMDMTMTMGINANVGGMSMPMNLPGMKMTADLAVTGVAANGDTSYTLAFSGVTVDAAGGEANPVLAGALQGMQSAITGIKGIATISNRGLVKSAKIESSDAQAQQMMGELTSQLENLATAFPEEAVGVGAKWETRQSMKTAGQYLFQKQVMEVVAIDGSTLKLKFTTEQTVPPQAFTNSMLPAGTDVQLDGGKGTGSGTMAVRLDSLIPTGDSTMTSTMSMTINMAGQSQPMSMENTIKLTIAPAPVK